MSRDNARTPMQWDDSSYAGFSDVEPWLAVNPNHKEINAAAQYDDPESVFEHYRRLIALRHEEPAVALGDFTLELPQHDRLFAYTRRHEDTELVVVANFSGDPVELPARLGERWLAAELVLTNLPEGGGATFAPWEARVLRRSGRSGSGADGAL